jgi:hypothetical protein
MPAALPGATIATDVDDMLAWWDETRMPESTPR